MSVQLRLTHTSALAGDERRALRELFDVAFPGGLSESEIEHSLGGMHATVWAGARLVGHGAVVQRRLLHGGRALRTGYLEAVAVHPEHRRRGHAGTVMDALEQVVRGAYELGALAATEDGIPLYAARGWQRWTGPASVLAPEGPRPTPDADTIFVLPVSVTLDPAADLACDWREGDVW